MKNKNKMKMNTHINIKIPPQNGRENRPLNAREAQQQHLGNINTEAFGYTSADRQHAQVSSSRSV